MIRSHWNHWGHHLDWWMWNIYLPQLLLHNGYMLAFLEFLHIVFGSYKIATTINQVRFTVEDQIEISNLQIFHFLLEYALRFKKVNWFQRCALKHRKRLIPWDFIFKHCQLEFAWIKKSILGCNFFLKNLQTSFKLHLYLMPDFFLIVLNLLSLDFEVVEKQFYFVIGLLGQILDILNQLLIEIADGFNQMLVALSMDSFLSAKLTQILLTFETVQLKLLVMCLTILQCVYPINVFQLVCVHDFGLVVVAATILAEIQFLRGAVDCWASVFTITTGVLSQFELLIIRDSEADLVLDFILRVMFQNKIILKCLLVIRRYYSWITLFYHWSLWMPRCS